MNLLCIFTLRDGAESIYRGGSVKKSGSGVTENNIRAELTVGRQSLQDLGQVGPLLGVQGKMLLKGRNASTGVLEQVRGASCVAVWGTLQVQRG